MTRKDLRFSGSQESRKSVLSSACEEEASRKGPFFARLSRLGGAFQVLAQHGAGTLLWARALRPDLTDDVHAVGFLLPPTTSASPLLPVVAVVAVASSSSSSSRHLSNTESGGAAAVFCARASAPATAYSPRHARRVG